MSEPVAIDRGRRKSKSPVTSSVKRKLHGHWLVTIEYSGGEKFGRIYADKTTARVFATRQKKSRAVKKARIEQLQVTRQ